MSTVVLCYEGADGNPVAVSATTPLPLSDAGAVQATEVGQPNGVASLDGSGKIPTSQMPVGDVTYKGNWNATTNTPTLADGVGTEGDLYICDVAGTQNLGGGSVAYGVGDWLIYDGAAWDRIAGHGPAPANPSVTVGLTAKNGTAATFMRSDAAPALDQTIVPTWTAKHTFTGAGGSATPSVSVASAIPVLEINYTGGGADAKKWNWLADANRIAFRAINDAGNTANEAWGVDRTAAVVTAQQFSTGGVNRLSISNTDLAAGTGYAPANALSLATKEYVDANLPAIVAVDGKSAQSANVNSPTFYAVPTSGMYRVSAFVVISQAATTSSTMPSVSVSYTEATTGTVVQDNNITAQGTTNLVGLHSGGTAIISAQQGSNIGYTTSGYASVGATPMQFSVHIKVEFLG